MLGVQHFIGYHDWTFEYLRRIYGEEAVWAYWGKPHPWRIELVREKGFDGRHQYRHHTLEVEEASCTMEQTENHFRINMCNCPTQGYQVEVGLPAYDDYCEHCIGWIKPLMDAARFIVDQEHNHTDQCYWEMQRAEHNCGSGAAPPVRGPHDVRSLAGWRQKKHHLYLKSQLVTGSAPGKGEGHSADG